MLDTEKLRRAIRTFELKSDPHSCSTSSSATVGDINKLRSSISDVLKAFVEELEKA